MSTEREMSTKVCSNCREVKLLEEFSKQRAKKDGHQYKCKACKKEYNAKWCASNPNYDAEYQKAHPEKCRAKAAKWSAVNSEKVKEYQAKWSVDNPEKRKASVAKYQKAHPEKCRAKDAKRRAAKLLAIPSWLTKTDYQAMEAIYTEAKRLEAETGLIHHVDHIHPLQGKLVCGLHCPANLQILTDSENKAKGNKFIPYVESEL